MYVYMTVRVICGQSCKTNDPTDWLVFFTNIVKITKETHKYV